MDENQSGQADHTPEGRGYHGVRITPPPSRFVAAQKGQPAKIGALQKEFPSAAVTPDKQARILTGAALFGVILVVLLHEFGHWLTGYAVTGKTPDSCLLQYGRKRLSSRLLAAC